jgi:molecular chaperone DnaK
MDRAAWDRRIAEIDARARQAYEAADAVAWRRVCDEVQALRETAHQDEFAAMRLDDPGYLARRIAAARYRASELEVALADLVLADAEPVRALQLAEQGRLLAALGAKVRDGLGRIDREPSDAVALRRRLERVETELERIETALGRVGSIGIVAEHAGGPERP